MDKELQAFVRYLKKWYPDPNGLPVYVRTRKLVGLHGSLNSNDKRHNIALRRNDDFNTMLDTLCHEWAHMLDHLDDSRKKEHRQSWGREYARVYQAYTDFKNQWEAKTCQFGQTLTGRI